MSTSTEAFLDVRLDGRARSPRSNYLNLHCPRKMCRILTQAAQDFRFGAASRAHTCLEMAEAIPPAQFPVRSERGTRHKAR